MPRLFASFANERFWECYDALPELIRHSADRAFELFSQDHQHPGLHFKKVGRSQPIYSARVTQNYRELGYLKNDTVYWFWIGDHKAYEKLLASI